MKKLNRSELETIIKLSAHEEFENFLAILRDSSYLLSVVNSRLKDEVEVRWNQGRVQELLDILKIISEARVDLELLKKQSDRKTL